MTRRSPGCGSQRLLRCRLHPAGRGPNSSSLFPPLAAVVAVASGLTDGSRAVSTKKEDPLLELALQEGVFFRFGESNELHCFYLLYFYHMPSPAKVKRCAESLQTLFSWHFLYLFVEVYDIMSLRLVPPNLPRMGEGGCRLMAYIFTFVLSVAANVASYYICKWLDGWLKGRKH